MIHHYRENVKRYSTSMNSISSAAVDSGA
jgi:hypothetical protein